MDGSAPDEDAKLDEALEETFSASDPTANTVETGIPAVRTDNLHFLARVVGTPTDNPHRP
jgi:hypothetical protein